MDDEEICEACDSTSVDVIETPDGPVIVCYDCGHQEAV